MEMFTLACSPKANFMDAALINGPTAASMKDSLHMENGKEKVYGNLIMETSLKVSIPMIQNMGGVNFYGKMDRSTKDSLEMI